MSNKTCPTIIDKYTAIRRYVKAIENLPPHFNDSSLFKTSPIPDIDFLNNNILERQLKEHTDSKKNMEEIFKSKKCGQKN